MKQRDSNNEVPAHFNNLMNMFTLESIAYIILSTRIGVLDENNQDENGKKMIEVCQASERLVLHSSDKYLFPQLMRQFFILTVEFEINPSIWRYYHTKAFKELLQVYDGITNLALHYIEKAAKQIESRPTQENEEESVLEKLLKINKKAAVVMCTDAMMAGIDTTASAAIGILYCLAKNQDKQEKLREELKIILPSLGEDLTPEMMRNMPYLRAVVKEGLRFFPPVIGNLRRADQDLVLSGYRIPKGTEVIMSQMLTYMDENQFPKPEKFMPERWIKTNKDPECPLAKDSAHAFAFLPFGFGARMCIGRRFAELEIEALISRIIQNYKVEWNYGGMKVKSVMVNVPEGDLKFKFTEIN
jgi:cytochrome P450 family 12